MRTNRIKAYARAGVDVEIGNTLKREIQSIVRSTHGPEVLGKLAASAGFSGSILK
jgi:phosphoribosylformylglycinamidine cyclo-ligase